ncbi:FAD-binding oxidoreductase [Neptunomonas japonica]|uniref:FAD-binding oxidoreductase n=1 Tax=Neptunomonas japonica TaxID=417574 RepID=UPI00040486ED|nr:FAD-binding oxidoreductase [Neptunomonas japonica]
MSLFIEKSLEQWAQILTPNQIITDQKTLEQYETATYETEQRISAILKPTNREQVQQITKIANQYNTPLYPISTGKNWGYGSSVPVTDGCVIVDLSSMNRIIKLSKELAYVTLEPGVTQKQLYEFLQSEHADLWMDATGASAECSIIGNTLERGFGHTEYGDHFSKVSGLEVVLANGECFHTGFGRFPNAQASEVYHWGVGAYLDGIFSQSNFGIVTQMTIWLMPAPEYSQAFFCSVDKVELPNLVDSLRPLRLDGTVKSAMHIVNADKAISAFGQYPWHEVNNITPLPRDWLAKKSKEKNVGGWNASGALYGTRAEVALARKKLKRALRHIPSKKLHFIDDRTLKIASYIARPYQWITGIDLEKALEMIIPVINLKRGVPSNTFIPSTYWRKKHPAPAPDQADPNKDRCGLLWLAPIAPMTGEHASALEEIIETTLLSFGFDPAISMTLLTQRCIDSVIAIAYDRDFPEEEERALKCHDELLEKLIDKGYYPYRLSTHAMGKLPKAEPAYSDVIAKFKHAIDPQHIIAPGRYEEYK